MSALIYDLEKEKESYWCFDMNKSTHIAIVEKKEKQ